jgi:hypothetical protein
MSRRLSQSKAPFSFDVGASPSSSQAGTPTRPAQAHWLSIDRNNGRLTEVLSSSSGLRVCVCFRCTERVTTLIGARSESYAESAPTKTSRRYGAPVKSNISNISPD